MSSEDVLTVGYWLGLAIKAAIGIVVTMVGLDYRAVKNSLHELEQAKYAINADISVIRYEVSSVNTRLVSIDAKLDKAIGK